MHQACYGISVVPDDDWYCAPCTKKVDMDRSGIKCTVCGTPAQRRDALQISQSSMGNTGWAHLICAYYFPGVNFGDIAARAPIIGYEKISPAHRVCTTARSPLLHHIRALYLTQCACHRN